MRRRAQWYRDSFCWVSATNAGQIRRATSSPGLPGGYAVATYQVVVTRVGPGRATGWTGTLRASFVDPPESSSASLYRRVQLVALNGGTFQGLWLVSAGSRYAAEGLVPGGPGEWSGALAVAGDLGQHTLVVEEVRYDDNRMDINWSGRFNQHDADGLAQRLGSTDPDDLERWDFDLDGSIDSYDVSLMQWLVDSGLDSRVLGDQDGDLEVDCADLQGVDAQATRTMQSSRTSTWTAAWTLQTCRSS